MPTYSARCPKCGHEEDYIARIADRDKTPRCTPCKKKMERFIVPPMLAAIGIADHFSIVSPIDGSQIHGRSEYYAHIQKHGVVPSSDLKGEAEHQKKQRSKVEKAKRVETIQQAIAKHGG